MDGKNLLAARFEAHRPRLRGVAYRMLGSATEADDAVQEAWLRLSRAGDDDIGNLGGWLTTVVARVCLDVLRARKARQEETLESPDLELETETSNESDPEREALIADSVGLALLVVLDTLSPAERLAFVLHDVFAVPFEQIGPIIDRSPGAAKQLASRARQRLRAAPTPAGADSGDGAPAAAGTVSTGSGDLSRQWAIVNAFLAASREGDFEGLLAILDPDIVLRADAGEGPFGPSVVVRGAREVIANAQRFAPLGRFARPVLVNGAPGFLVTRDGEALALLAVTVRNGKIAEMDVLADPVRLRELDLVGLTEP